MSDSDEINIVDSDDCCETSHPSIPEAAATENAAGDRETRVCARTDGIRGKRYGENTLIGSSSAESGEVLGEEGNILFIAEQPRPTQKVTTKEPSKDGTWGSVSTPSNRNDIRPIINRSIKKDVYNNSDVFEIGNIVKAESPEGDMWGKGIQKLMTDYRQHALHIDSDSETDDPGRTMPPSDLIGISSDDSDFERELSLASEVFKISKINLKSDFPDECFPEVEIVDLTLAETEQILPLGRIFKVVNDFIVITCHDSSKVLDLDSMIFNSDRKCVGYIFEVLGAVADPYYSVHFNTHSDIETLGLSEHQELFYSPNEKYSRYVLAGMLRELEKVRYRSEQAIESDGSGDSDGSEMAASKPRKVRKRKQEAQLQNRTTNNYSISYETSSYKKPRQRQEFSGNQPSDMMKLQNQYGSRPNSFVDRRQNTGFKGQRPPNSFVDRGQNASLVGPRPPNSFVAAGPPNRPWDSASVGVQNSQNHPLQSFSRQAPEGRSNQTNLTNMDPAVMDTSSAPSQGLFRNSVLASFLDPFSLDKPSDS